MSTNLDNVSFTLAAMLLIDEWLQSQPQGQTAKQDFEALRKALNPVVVGRFVGVGEGYGHLELIPFQGEPLRDGESVCRR